MWITNETQIIDSTARELTSNGETGDRRIGLSIAQRTDRPMLEPYITTNGDPKMICGDGETSLYTVTIDEAAEALGCEPQKVIDLVREACPAIDWSDRR